MSAPTPDLAGLRAACDRLREDTDGLLVSATVSADDVRMVLDALAVAEAERDEARAVVAEVRALFDLQCPPMLAENYVDRGAWMAHEWWNTCLGAVLRRHEDRQNRPLAPVAPPVSDRECGKAPGGATEGAAAPSGGDSEGECICPYTDPSTWLLAASCGYGSGYEPGGMQEWDPDCPMHPADEDEPCLHVFEFRPESDTAACLACGIETTYDEAALWTGDRPARVSGTSGGAA